MSEISSAGTTLEISQEAAGALTPTWLRIDQGIESFDAPEPSREQIAVTAISDTATRYITGILDAGEISITVNRRTGDTGQAAMRAAWDAEEARDFRITFSDGATIVFQGIFTAMGFGSVAQGSAVSFSATLRINGEPLLTEPT